MKNSNLLALYAIILATAACSGGDSGGDSGGGEAPTEAVSVEQDVKPDVSLTNTYWKLVELNGAPVEPGEGKDLHMILKGQDQVGGYSGCNQFMGSFTASGDGLSFGPIAGTRRMCESVMEQEYAFLQALENASRYEISGEDMTISNAQVAVTLCFVAVYLE